MLGKEDWQMPIIERLLFQTDKCSHRRCYMKEAVRKNFTIFTGKHLCWSLFWDEVEIKARKTWNFIEKRLQHRFFSVNIAKFLTTPVLKNISARLLLKIIKKDFLAMPPVHSNHYMITIGGQRPKISGEWTLAGPYLQRYADTPTMGVWFQEFLGANCLSPGKPGVGWQNL